MAWQSFATIVLIAIAAFIVGRKAWAMVGHQAGSPCGGCSGCSSKSPAVQVQVTPLIQLGQSFGPSNSAVAKLSSPATKPLAASVGK